MRLGISIRMNGLGLLLFVLESSLAPSCDYGALLLVCWGLLHRLVFHGDIVAYVCGDVCVAGVGELSKGLREGRLLRGQRLPLCLL